MKSWTLLLLAALAIVTTATAADEKKKSDAKELVSHLVERTGEITHDIYAFEAKLDARLDPDRIRRAGSLRHRVEELERPKCEEHETNCGGDDHQCVSHLFYCDGHKDCRNGDDEKHCDVPLKAGDEFDGEVVFDRCTQRKPEHITLKIESVTTAAFFKGFPKVHAHIEMETDDDDHEADASLPSDGHYSLADHELLLDAPEDDGLGFHGQFDGHNFDRFVGDIVHSASKEPCARFIFHRDHHDDDHHDHDHHDDHHDHDHHDDHHDHDHHDDHHDDKHHDKHHDKKHHGKGHDDDHHVEHHGKKGHH